MTLQNYLVIVIGENDNKFPYIKQQVTAEYQAEMVTFAHAPIGSNTFVTMNGLHDALNGVDSTILLQPLLWRNELICLMR